MDFCEFEKKIKNMMKSEIQGYKKMVNSLPEDETVCPYLKAIDKTVGNIEHICDVYVSVKLMRAMGAPIELSQEEDGSLYYRLPFGKDEGVRKKNGKDIMYE